MPTITQSLSHTQTHMHTDTHTHTQMDPWRRTAELPSRLLARLLWEHPVDMSVWTAIHPDDPWRSQARRHADTHTLSHTHTHTRTLTHTHSHTHSLTHTNIHAHTHTTYTPHIVLMHYTVR